MIRPSVRAIETRRRQRRRAERLAKAEREWVLGHPDDEYRDVDGRTVSFSLDTQRLAEYFAARCLLRQAARDAMVDEARQLLATKAPGELTCDA